MKEKEDSIVFFEGEILEFYQEHGRKHLPWRKKHMPAYEVWVSEIMLQQTQVDRVIDFYTRFLKRFPTVSVLARASWEEFVPYYQGLGYYNRGRNMLAAAKVAVEKYEGKFPREIRELEKLPGVGRYTARAIVSFTTVPESFYDTVRGAAHADDTLAWDTNFQRVFGRFFRGSKDAIMNPEEFEGKIHGNKRDFNGAIMDFGSLVCVKKPKCETCLLRAKCVYFRENGKREQVAVKKKDAFPTREADAFVFLHKGHKVYYSESKRKYRPFRVPKTHNTRDGIKRYFQEKYGLTLSVRPPREKLFVKNKPVLLVNAQVLLGEPRFREYAKRDVGIT